MKVSLYVQIPIRQGFLYIALSNDILKGLQTYLFRYTWLLSWLLSFNDNIRTSINAILAYFWISKRIFIQISFYKRASKCAYRYVANQSVPEFNKMFLGLSAAISSVLTNVFMTPLDTIRARYQLSTKKLSVADVIKELWSNEGYKGFYKGSISNALFKSNPNI